MKFAILIYESEKDFAARSNPETVEAYMAPFTSYSKALADAGVAVSGLALDQPSTSITLRIRDGKLDKHDGPFAETKEQIGGFMLIDVPGIEEAVQWAARCPSASSCRVEIRPVLAPSPECRTV